MAFILMTKLFKDGMAMGCRFHVEYIASYTLFSSMKPLLCIEKRLY